MASRANSSHCLLLLLSTNDHNSSHWFVSLPFFWASPQLDVLQRHIFRSHTVVAFVSDTCTARAMPEAWNPLQKQSVNQCSRCGVNYLLARLFHKLSPTLATEKLLLASMDSTVFDGLSRWTGRTRRHQIFDLTLTIIITFVALTPFSVLSLPDVCSWWLCIGVF